MLYDKPFHLQHRGLALAVTRITAAPSPATQFPPCVPVLPIPQPALTMATPVLPMSISPANAQPLPSAPVLLPPVCAILPTTLTPAPTAPVARSPLPPGKMAFCSPREGSVLMPAVMRIATVLHMLSPGVLSPPPSPAMLPLLPIAQPLMPPALLRPPCTPDIAMFMLPATAAPAPQFSPMPATAELSTSTWIGPAIAATPGLLPSPRPPDAEAFEPPGGGFIPTMASMHVTTAPPMLLLAALAWPATPGPPPISISTRPLPWPNIADIATLPMSVVPPGASNSAASVTLNTIRRACQGL